MSTVHAHPAWREMFWGKPSEGSGVTRTSILNREWIDLGDIRLPAFSPKKAPVTKILGVHYVIAYNTVSEIHRRVMEHIKCTSSTSSPTFAVDATRLIDTVSKGIPTPKSPGTETHSGPHFFGTAIAPAEYPTCLKLATNLALSHFKGKEMPSFPITITKGEMEKWGYATMVAMGNTAFAALGIQPCPTPIHFTGDDLTAFGLTEAPVDPKSISCLSFALLLAHRRETQLKGVTERGCLSGPKEAEIIFDPKQAEKSFTHLADYLLSLNYRTVSTPDEGDLVVYFDKDLPKHVGYFSETGKIHSKFGLRNPISHIHNLFDVLPDYGNKVVFFRKSVPLFSDAELAAESAEDGKEPSFGVTA